VIVCFFFALIGDVNFSFTSPAHIATVGKAMSSSEEVAYPILRKHDVDYVLVIFGGLIGYSGDDINKFLWMVRIAQGIWPDEIQEPNYFTPQGEYRVDAQASTTMKNSLMYKMSYYRCGVRLRSAFPLLILVYQFCGTFWGHPSHGSCPEPGIALSGPHFKLHWYVYLLGTAILVVSCACYLYCRGSVHNGKLDCECRLLPARRRVQSDFVGGC